MLICSCSNDTGCVENFSNDTETNIIPAEPNKTTLYYSSFDDFYKELSNDDYCNKFNECGKHFNSLLRMSCNNSDCLYEPAYNGERVELKSLNENIIVLFSQEKFNLPWIWYFCETGEKKFVIEICYLDDVDEIEISDDASYSDISQCLSPSYATAKTFNEKDRKVYKSIIEKNIILFDNSEVTASVFDYNEENYWHRINYRFRYKNILVSVWNWDAESYDSINDDFMSALSFI